MFLGERVCMFWNITSLLWSSEGCELDENVSNSETATCVCQHLTEFAMMAQSRTSEVFLQFSRTPHHTHKAEIKNLLIRKDLENGCKMST